MQDPGAEDFGDIYVQNLNLWRTVSTRRWLELLVLNSERRAQRKNTWGARDEYTGSLHLGYGSSRVIRLGYEQSFLQSSVLNLRDNYKHIDLITRVHLLDYVWPRTGDGVSSYDGVYAT